MAVREYVGARYVPLFAEPAQWSDTRTYEPLTIVMNEGNSYTSRQYVPLGIPLTDENYWALTGNYNAQVEAYRKEVAVVKNELEDVKASSIKTYSTVSDMKNAKCAVGDIIKTEGFHSPGIGGGVYRVGSGTANGYNAIALANGLTATLATGDVTLAQLGALFNGNDDTAVFQFAAQNYVSFNESNPLVLREVDVSASIHIKLGVVKCQAVKIKTGGNGSLEIKELTGGGIVYANTGVVENFDVHIGYAKVPAAVIRFENTSGVLDSEISGGYWESTAGNAIEFATNTENSYVGQIEFNVSRVVAAAGWGVYVNIANSMLTGVDFGYMSLEGCKNSIFIKSNTANSIENMYGTFRIYENNTPRQLVLEGNATMFVSGCTSELTFDHIKFSQIDTSALVQTKYTATFGNTFIIRGGLCSETGTPITNMAVLKGDWKFVPFALGNSTVNDSTKYDTWMASSLMTNVASIVSGTSNVELPSYWNGQYDMVLTNNNQPVNIKYKLPDGTFHSQSLTFNTVVLNMYFDSNGDPTYIVKYMK